jgi:hypothetical protein
VYKIVVVSDPRQIEVAALNATLANTTATAELTQFQLAQSMRAAVRTATELMAIRRPAWSMGWRRR